jgi:beta-mannosidase
MAQAHTYKYAIESFRYRMPQCSGSLFWQWNDPWPTTCWSVIDYYHKPKMAYFWSKKAYQNVYPVLKKTKHGEIEAWVINDTVKKIPAKLELILDAFNGKYSDKYVIDLTISPCASQKVVENALSYFKLKNPKTEVLRARLIFNHQESDNAFYFVPLVEQQLGKAEITAWKKTGKKETQVILKSETLVRMVELKTSEGDLWFSDNYFDLYPGESKMVTIPGNQPIKILIQGFNSDLVVV